MKDDATELLDLFVRRGGQPTAPRRAILASLPRQGPFRPDELWQAVRAVHPALGRATVFRTLRLLHGLGIIERVADAAGGPGYRLCLACGRGHHHHLRCADCGRDTLIEGPRLQAVEAALTRLQAEYGHTPLAHELDLVGRCPDCRGRGDGGGRG